MQNLAIAKKEELERIVSIIREMCDDLEIIILFGENTREVCPGEENSQSDTETAFDLLVICGNPKTAENTHLWNNISKNCNNLLPDMSFRIITHDIKYLKKRLRQTNFFFNDILQKGSLLYNSDRYKLIVKEITPEKHLKIAEKYFTQYYDNASGFYRDFENAYFKEDYVNAAFYLHRSAEAACKALLLVFTNYAPNDHYLRSAVEQIREVLPGMEDIFPRETIADKELFYYFDSACSGAPRDSKFKISSEDLQYLSSRVKLLLDLSKTFCAREIRELQEAALQNSSEKNNFPA